MRRDSVGKEAVYLVMGLKENFEREVLGIYTLPQESAGGWDEVLADIHRRGVEQIGLVTCDESSGIDGSIRKHFPNSYIQYYLLYKLRQLTKVVRNKLKADLNRDFWQVFNLNRVTDMRADLKQRLEAFLCHWSHQYPRLKNKLREERIEHYTAYLNYPAGVRKIQKQITQTQDP